MPLPMKPRANRVDESFPATGLSAAAASAAPWMVLAPCAPRVEAVATMMANITTLDRTIPDTTSNRAWRWVVFALAFERSLRGIALAPPRSSSRSSSTRWAVCQKNRYGEMVVPSTATSSAR